jgi:hypothetical protein
MALTTHMVVNALAFSTKEQTAKPPSFFGRRNVALEVSMADNSHVI